MSSIPRSAQDVIRALNLSPHPEKGFYLETYRDLPSTTAAANTSTERPSTGSPPDQPCPKPPRAHSTYIYYLLRGSDGPSHWHRVLDALEVWHYYAGAPLRLDLSSPESSSSSSSSSSASASATTHILGPDLWSQPPQRPQVIIQPAHWQRARSLGDWTLVGCSVAPGFEFDAFEMAEPGWEPDAFRAGAE